MERSKLIVKNFGPLKDIEKEVPKMINELMSKQK